MCTFKASSNPTQEKGTDVETTITTDLVTTLTEMMRGWETGPYPLPLEERVTRLTGFFHDWYEDLFFLTLRDNPGQEE